MNYCWTLALILLIPNNKLMRATFELTVKFINYTNPTGLCAECQTGLENVTSADELTPVCCDESPFRSDNCDNTGEARCDTRFRWTLRPFGAALGTRPASVTIPAYGSFYFTDCDLSNNTCPFSETSTTFNQTPTGFLGVAANPLPVVPRFNTFTSWPGQVQFFIEAVDNGLPNIIDSLLINLDNLQLGADFTEEMTFTGYHNISHMTISFRVACQTGFCGRDCSITRLNHPRISECHPNGDIVCVDSRYNPLANCESCLYNLDFSTGCSTCLEPNFDPDTNCTSCLPGINCATCQPRHDPLTNCTQCLPNRDLSTNCTQCSPGWDISSDCMSCLPHRDPSTNCTQCLPNHDPSTDCFTCHFGFDINRECSVCLPGRNISTNCTICLFGYAGENCVQDIVLTLSPTLMVRLQPNISPTLSPQPSVNLVGGITGGVVIMLVMFIVIGNVILVFVIYKVKKNPKETLEKALKMKQNPVYNMTTDAPPQPSTADSDNTSLQSTVLYEVSTEPD